tara:strand:+ start:121484 stop:122443 length:960 start_codon:yes stop_codon:yes gene_type:complete
MGQVFSTSGIPSNERFERWICAVSDIFTPFSSHAPRPCDFNATIKSVSAKDILVARLISSTLSVSHGRSEIAHTDTDELFFVTHLNTTGSHRFIVEGREMSLNAGDSIILDSARPYSMDFTGAFDHVSVSIPKAVWEERSTYGLPDIGSPIRAVGGVFQSYMSLLSEEGEKNRLLQEGVAENLLNLCILLAQKSDVARERDDACQLHEAKMRAIRNFIHSSLRDETLSPASAARHVGVSLRTLHDVFRSYNTTFRTYVTEQRLVKVRAELSEPRSRHRTIAEIAYKHGFADLSTFGRAFKTRFSATPTEYRQRYFSSEL